LDVDFGSEKHIREDATLAPPATLLAAAAAAAA
jgi:hypothetical protein